TKGAFTDHSDDAFQGSFLHLSHFGRRLMRRLCLNAVAAALVGATSWTAASYAATFSGSSADITDFTNGTEVSLEGQLVDAINVLNDNVGGIGVSTTINGVLF